MKIFLFINIAFVILFSSVSIFAQDTTADLAADDPIAIQAQARPKEQLGMYLFWFTQMNPLSLLNDKDSELSAMKIMNPCFEIEWGYGTPWFFDGKLRFSFKFWAYGRYNWSDYANGLDSDSNNLGFMMFLNAYITPYLVLEFDTRGRLQIFTSYTWRVPQHQVKVELSTRFWLSGNGYRDKDGVALFQRSMWDYTTLDVHYFYNPTVSPRINRFTLYTRFRLRLLGNIYNRATHPDTGELFDDSNPNTANLLYFSTRFRFETWLSPYFAVIPLVEFVVNGSETTSIRQPYGLNIGIMTRFGF